jgi:hypothetical protein
VFNQIKIAMKKGIFLILILAGIFLNMGGQGFNPGTINFSGFCIMVYMPVCGCDGHIYSNSCVASLQGITTCSAINEISISGPQTICQGDTVQLVANGGSYYTWNNGYHTNSILVSPNTTQQYTVLASFPGGCQLSKDLTITVNPTYFISRDRYIQFGDTIIIGKNKFYNPGNYYNTLFTITGCDSIINSNIRLFNRDTCFAKIYDTINIYDTIKTNYVDTIFTNVFDTTLITVYDTVIYHDSIFVSIIDSSNLLSKTKDDMFVLDIYPNPASKYLKIVSPIEITNYQLYYADGELKRNENVFSREAVIYLDDFAKGIYVLKLKMKNSLQVTRKVLIE